MSIVDWDSPRRPRLTEAIAKGFANLVRRFTDLVPTTSEHQPNHQSQVRFKPTIEEIAPDNRSTEDSHPPAHGASLGNPGEVTPADIHALSDRLRICPLQERRMNIFSYEPVSLPPSRVRIFLRLPAFTRSLTSVDYLGDGTVLGLFVGSPTFKLVTASSDAGENFRLQSVRLLTNILTDDIPR